MARMLQKQNKTELYFYYIYIINIELGAAAQFFHVNSACLSGRQIHIHDNLHST